MIVRNFQRSNSTYPFSSETHDSLSSKPGIDDQCLHHQLYGEFDLEIICRDGGCGAHQVVLGQASKMLKDILIGDTWQLDNGDVLNVVNSRKTNRTMFLPDIKKSTAKNLLSVIYTGDVVMTSLEEAGELKALWRLLKIDLIHIKDLQILFETEGSNSHLDTCHRQPTGQSNATSQVVEITPKKSSKWRRSRVGLNKTKRRFKFQPLNRKHKKTSRKKLLTIFEEFLAQALKSKVPVRKEDTNTIHIEEADNEGNDNTENVIKAAQTESIQPRATIIQPTATMISQNTLSYEDQNFSYDIDLFASENIEHDAAYQPQDVTYQEQNTIYQSQNHSVCIPFLQDQPVQVPLQLPLSYTQRPSIFVPVSFSDQLSVSNASTSRFSYLPNTTEVSPLSQSSISPVPLPQVPLPKQSLVNLPQRYVSQKIAVAPQIVYDTDGLALLPNLQNEEYPDILDAIRSPHVKDEGPSRNMNLFLGNSFELLGMDGDVGQEVFRKIPKKIPKFRENNNWVGNGSGECDKGLPGEKMREPHKSRKKITVIDKNYCKKINLIKDHIPPHKRKIKLNKKFSDFFNDKPGGVVKNKEGLVVGIKHTAGGTKSIKKLDVVSKGLKTPFGGIECGKQPEKELNSETKGHEKSVGGNKCSKNKFTYMEEPKYEMDQQMIQNYLMNQSKLKVRFKWKIDPEFNTYDKSNDRNLRKENRIRTSLVDLPNILQHPEGILHYPQYARSKTKKRSTNLSPLTTISRNSALQAINIKSLSINYASPIETREKFVADLLDNILYSVVNRNYITIMQHD